METVGKTAGLALSLPIILAILGVLLICCSSFMSYLNYKLNQK